MYELGSGDWIGLDEAAQMICEGRQIKKTAEDVVKAGYIAYQGIANRLKIYTFPRTAISITPYEPEWMDEADKLAGKEKLLAFRACISGAMFQLHPDILERLLALRILATNAHTPFAVIQRDDADSLEGVIRPDIEILWEDLRVDREELREFIEDMRRAAGVEPSAGAANDEPDSSGKPEMVKIRRKALIEKYESYWPTIRSDLDNRSRPERKADPHGLHTAVVPGKPGCFYEEIVVRWGRNNGRFIKEYRDSNSIHDSPTSVKRNGWLG